MCLERTTLLRRRRRRRAGSTTTLLGMLLVVLLHCFNHVQAIDESRLYPMYTCPTQFEERRVEVDLYQQDNEKHHLQNVTHFVQTIRHQTADYWGRTYEELKQGLYPWKSNIFQKIELHNGDSIYESASGVGMNLLLTLEIMAEVQNVSNLVVYGNDYIAQSAALANALLDDRDTLPNGARKGVICQGDSSNLDFVPSNSFDVVFTGYINPLRDPLGYGGDDNKNDVASLWYRYKRLCQGGQRRHDGRHHQERILRNMQRIQEDWFDAWVSELIRIAKPGAPVLIEQVAHNICTSLDDWGGVDDEFWLQHGIHRYGWDIDPASIEFQNDETMEIGRYNVMMRKNK